MFELSAVTSFLVFFIFVLLSVRITYVIVVKHWNYFSERNARFERGAPLLGSLYPTMLGRLSMADTLPNIYNKFSNDKFLGMFELGGKPIYMVRDPELIQTISTKDFDYFVNHYFQMDKKMEPLLGRVLFSMKDQDWRDMRSVLSPLFTDWTKDDLVAQCIIFFIAGFTGAATTLSFLCHELAVSQDVQERLYQEIQEMHENNNGERVKFEDLQKRTYLDMVVSELLRMWPIPLMDRRVSKQYVLENGDGTKVVLQPDDIILLPILAIQRDPKYYPEPLKFYPERFSDVNKKNILPGTYAPFGFGPRACIASRFALMQIKSTIFHMLLEFKIECSSQTQIPIKLKAGTNQLATENGFWTQLKLIN